MPRPSLYVTRALPGGAIEFLKHHAAVRVWRGEEPPPADELVQQAARSDAILSLLTDRIDANLLSNSPRLAIVSNMATGFDNIDVAAASAQNVLVTRTPGVLSETTAEFTIALLFAVSRRIVEGDRSVRDGQWKTWGPNVLLGVDLAGSTLGIIGLGGVGEAVAQRARALGMRVKYYSRTRKRSLEKELRIPYSSFTSLLEKADFVSLHVPLTAETRHLIGKAEFDLMKPSAVLINTARGPLVNQSALYNALNRRRIAAAAIDVSDPEPMPPNDPLLTLPNAIVTPHIASASIATRSRMAMLAAENLVQALQGSLPKHTVNRNIARQWKERVRNRFTSS
jgi:glyoxylate reductase